MVSVIFLSYHIGYVFFFMLQFNFMKGQGTCIVIYNLWEDDEGKLEMDFDSDPHVCP